MRFFFGLAGLLVAIGVIAWLMSSQLTHDQQVIKTGNQITEQVSQLAGVVPGSEPGTHRPASSSIGMEIMTKNNSPVSILVTKVEAGGAFEKYFGIKKDDTILAIEYQGVKRTIKEMNDEEMAKAQVADSYQHQGYLYVRRSGVDGEVKLPQPSAAMKTTPAPTAESPAEAPAPAPQPNSGRNSLQRQLDAVTAPR